MTAHYSEKVVSMAKRLLDNPEIAAIFETRRAELQADIMLSTDPKDILDAHTEHAHLMQFMEWIQHVAGQ